MRTWLTSIYCGFRNIAVIGDTRSRRSALDALPTMDGERVVQFTPPDFSSLKAKFGDIDLIIIDIDAFGLEKSKLYIFLASCLTPNTPLVLITKHYLEKSSRRCLLAGARVLGIIELNRSIDVPA